MGMICNGLFWLIHERHESQYHFFPFFFFFFCIFCSVKIEKVAYNYYNYFPLCAGYILYLYNCFVYFMCWVLLQLFWERGGLQLFYHYLWVVNALSAGYCYFAMSTNFLAKRRHKDNIRSWSLISFWFAIPLYLKLMVKVLCSKIKRTCPS